MCSLAEFRFSKFQSTFPRGERHLWFSLNRNRHMISIHVPAWGTTNIFLSTLVLIPISIHVPAWGTTSYSLMRTLAFVISIHVPAWGTTVNKHDQEDVMQFQSTFPRGERRLILGKTFRLTKFQSTFPRGERRLVSPFLIKA